MAPYSADAGRDRAGHVDGADDLQDLEAHRHQQRAGEVGAPADVAVAEQVVGPQEQGGGEDEPEEDGEGQSVPGCSCSAGPSAEVARNSVPAPTSQASATARSSSPRPFVCQAAFMAFWRAPTTPRPAQSRPTRPMIVAVRRCPPRW